MSAIELWRQNCPDYLAEAEAKIEVLEAKLEAMEIQLIEYQHLNRCPQATGPYDLGELEPRCICGRDEWLAAQQEKEE